MEIALKACALRSIVGASLLLVASLHAADWTTFGHDPQRTLFQGAHFRMVTGDILR